MFPDPCSVNHGYKKQQVFFFKLFSLNAKNVFCLNRLLHTNHPFPCPECGEPFKRRKDLDLHSLVHQGQMGFQPGIYQLDDIVLAGCRWSELECVFFCCCCWISVCKTYIILCVTLFIFVFDYWFHASVEKWQFLTSITRNQTKADLIPHCNENRLEMMFLSVQRTLNYYWLTQKPLINEHTGLPGWPILFIHTHSFMVYVHCSSDALGLRLPIDLCAMWSGEARRG